MYVCLIERITQKQSSNVFEECDSIQMNVTTHDRNITINVTIGKYIEISMLTRKEEYTYSSVTIMIYIF